MVKTDGENPVIATIMHPDGTKLEVRRDDRGPLKPFIAAMWDAAGHDHDKMITLLAENPVMSTLFTIDSPEVQEVMSNDS